MRSKLRIRLTFGAVILSASVPVGSGDARWDPLGDSMRDARKVLEACLDASDTGLTHSPNFGRRGDGWPRKVKGVGIVRELVPGYCGIACTASQVRIEIEETDRRFLSGSLFAYAFCVAPDDVAAYCNKRVTFVAKKIYVGKEPCGVTDSFDSGATPFYLIDKWHNDVIVVEEDGEVGRLTSG
jgi:hypothetical protein